jgi:hypothetical protein
MRQRVRHEKMAGDQREDDEEQHGAVASTKFKSNSPTSPR